MTRSERSNPQSGDAFFVMAFLAWQTGEREEAVRRLEQAAATRSENRKPAGVVAEGEVRQKMHVEAVPCEDLYDA
jgi:hypothetical protein